jgi:hypothetical protein
MIIIGLLIVAVICLTVAVILAIKYAPFGYEAQQRELRGGK